MSTTNQSDADFFRLIHQMVGPLAADEQSERRSRRRDRFLTWQRIAPWDGGPLPEDDAFLAVRCYDLTQGGFSFFLPTRPKFPFLVAAFGQPPELIYVGAEVVRCSRVLLHASGLVDPIHDRATHVSYRSPDGQLAQPMILVGCRFVKRLDDRRP